MHFNPARFGAVYPRPAISRAQFGELRSQTVTFNLEEVINHHFKTETDRADELADKVNQSNNKKVQGSAILTDATVYGPVRTGDLVDVKVLYDSGE